MDLWIKLYQNTEIIRLKSLSSMEGKTSHLIHHYAVLNKRLKLTNYQ